MQPYYPVPTERNRLLYAELQRRAAEIPRVVFVGRLANYKYMNMDEAIANALDVPIGPNADSSDGEPDEAAVEAELHVVTAAYKVCIGLLKSYTTPSAPLHCSSSALSQRAPFA